MSSTRLERAVTISQAARPLQVCYIVPYDAPSTMLTAVFKECYERWGGRDTLIIPTAEDGTIYEAYWKWARSIDPDIVYSYIPLDISLLERIDRELMPATISVHQDGFMPGYAPHHESNTIGLSSLSVLPMLASADRLGPPRRHGRLGLLSNYDLWARDSFITDTFGLNPVGPGWAQAPIIQRYAATFALGTRDPARPYAVADQDVPSNSALLREMCVYDNDLWTMAQLSGTAYENLLNQPTSNWRNFNIVIGATNLDRISFWNSRIGVDDFHRRSHVGVRLDAEHLTDADFIDALAVFIAQWNPFRSQSNPSFATLRSSSVQHDKFTDLVASLQRHGVHVTTIPIMHITDCTPGAFAKIPMLRSGSRQRYVEAEIPLEPIRPRHLRGFEHISPWLAHGRWAIQIGLHPDTATQWFGSLPKLGIPRRWQAVRYVAAAALAKATLGGDIRALVQLGDLTPTLLKFPYDDSAFIQNLLGPVEYLTTTDPRRVIPQRPSLRPAISASGRHLIGLLGKAGTIFNASELLHDEFTGSILIDMALPIEMIDADKRSAFASRLKKILTREGIQQLDSDETYARLAEVAAEQVSEIKSPLAIESFEWFVKRFRLTEDGKRAAERGDRDAARERHLFQEVEARLRDLCERNILIQGRLWKCPRCLHRNWVTVSALLPVLMCDVCRREESLATHFSWDFLLDGYVSRGIRENGLRGLVWALSRLRVLPRSSFMFTPPIDIYQGDEKITDLDIACILDGEFIIGEVKESARHIGPALAENLIKVAEIIRPDVVVLACLDPMWRAQDDRHFERLAEGIGRFGIRAMALVGSPEDVRATALAVAERSPRTAVAAAEPPPRDGMTP